MNHYIETPTNDGQPIRIEVEEITRSQTVFTRPDLSSDKAKNAYCQTLSTIKGFADGIVNTIKSLDTQFSSASVEFAVKIDAESGPMIAKIREAGQFKISLSWKQSDADQ